MIEPAIRFDNLGHAYRPGRWVFRHCSAQLERGRVLALLGPNGRGKTTLLRLLLGAMKASEGSLVVQGRTAFVPQLFQVGFDYSVLDMVLMGRARHIGLLSQPSARDEAAALAALDRFGLADLARRPFHELSGGQRQMTIFARALVSDADILILDEPTSALDLKNQALVLDWIQRLAGSDGLTVLFSTHHPHHALEVADDALLMLGESDFAHGPASTVLTEDNLHALYGIPLRRLAFQHGGETMETVAAVWRNAASA
ncbi:MAG TPA: ABC transporter ATP-binding protein [Patescibacteria group bacterium]|nr:ABC transporter ATP-binding protein [Patescibacteria group bacterium]